MSKQSLRNAAKEALKVAFSIPRKNALRRTADLYSNMPIDPSEISPKRSKTIKSYIAKRAFGSESVDFFEHIRRNYGKSFEHGASLGSHHANFERDLMTRGLVRNMDCYEISPGAIVKAKALAQNDGLTNIRFFEQNLNDMKFERAKYNAIFAFKSLHHVENLEGLFERVRAALLPDGYFFVDDFFGPRRLQWTDEQLRITNEILALLPDELKVDLGSFRPKIHGERKRSSIEENIAIDPSEAVRSDDVLPVLKKYFEVIEEKDYGGNIYLLLFNKIMGNFRDDHPLSQTIIRLIMYIEEQALKTGTLKSSDFKYLIARPLPKTN